MTASNITAVPAGRPRIVGLARVMARKVSDRAHAAADGRARARGWEVTEARGRLGLSGRSYRDPRFDARGHARQEAQAGRDGRRD
jgi:hypothetical protein